MIEKRRSKNRKRDGEKIKKLVELGKAVPLLSTQ